MSKRKRTVLSIVTFVHDHRCLSISVSRASDLAVSTRLPTFTLLPTIARRSIFSILLPSSNNRQFYLYSTSLRSSIHPLRPFPPCCNRLFLRFSSNLAERKFLRSLVFCLCLCPREPIETLRFRVEIPRASASPNPALSRELNLDLRFS